MVDTSKAPGAEQQRMVNWEVVSRNVDTLTTIIKRLVQADRLTRALPSTHRG